MSRPRLATVFSSGKIGFVAYASDPSRPRSSAVQKAKAIVRSGGGAALNSRAISNSPATPSASSLRSEEHTSELQSLMRIPYAVFCLTKIQTIRRQYAQDII